ncbi:unnamed protein product [Staurois parvus]|uniref:Uncharacterized protein n=1 Tax=Staurois parvus TaxID=386267 RepID=A0ABN9GM17_9NEOB|nr:unnamed protein product [Staurois parvus]
MEMFLPYIGCFGTTRRRLDSIYPVTGTTKLLEGDHLTKWQLYLPILGLQNTSLWQTPIGQV